MAVRYELKQIPSSMSLVGFTVVEPDLDWNAQMGILSDFNCCVCLNGIGISWKQGVQPGLVARCPHCGTFNEFVRYNT